MTYEDYYKTAYPTLLAAEKQLTELIKSFPHDDASDVKPIVYTLSRIKTPDSMIRKLEGRGLTPTLPAALTQVYDAVGIRIICAFADDVISVVNWLKAQPVLKIEKEKDYLIFPKPNGYRSYHLLVSVINDGDAPVHAEIQVRTIAIDFWATLEHQIKYKKDIPQHYEALLRSELKRCADEIASVDLSMQALKELIKDFCSS